MIKLAHDTIDKEDIKLLVEWLTQEETPRLTKDKLTEEFEAEWSKKCGQKYSVFVNSGSSAILLGLYYVRVFLGTTVASCESFY